MTPKFERGGFWKPVTFDNNFVVLWSRARYVAQKRFPSLIQINALAEAYNM